ncbi:MAG: hypothetical protein IKY22_09815 [Bacteroidales bacterium]|nr:hypothetical protein [Bacteroidales bacterium]MBR5778744.1 hypothetical protein [Bacteroidales bacterium]
MNSKLKANKKELKLKITLSERDNILLSNYAREHNISRAIAAKQILHQSLIANAKQLANTAPENQLCLFDNVQIDIFDIIKEETKNQKL